MDISSGRAAKKEWWNCPLSLIHRYLRFRTRAVPYETPIEIPALQGTGSGRAEVQVSMESKIRGSTEKCPT